MTARRSMAVLAALVVALVLALLGGLLLIDGARPRSASPEGKKGGTVPATPQASAERMGERSAVSPSPTLPVEESPPTGGPAFHLTVEVRFEDGTPYPEATLLSMHRGQDGVPETDLDLEMTGGTATPADGMFTLGWNARPDEILLLFVSKEVEVVSVAGGRRLDPADEGEVLHADGGATLGIRVRWRAGCVLVHILDQAGEELLWNSGVFLRWRMADGSAAKLASTSMDNPGLGFHKVLPPKPSREAAAKALHLEIGALGYETVRVPIEEARGDLEVRLGPAVPDVTAALEFAAGRVGPICLGWGIQPRGKAIEEVRGTISVEDGIRLYDVPEGRWTLAVRSFTSDGIRWAVRTFEKGAVAVNLGTLSFTGSSSVRARAVDADGTPMLVPLACDSLMAVETWSGWFDITEGDYDMAGKLRGFGVQDDPPPDADGWERFSDLGPGVQYRFFSDWPSDTSINVVAPTEPGATRDVEIRLPHRLVAGNLRFTVEGGKPVEWGEIESERLAAGWHGDGSWEGRLYPGSYTINVHAKRYRILSMRPYRVTFEIPTTGPFDMTIDLK